MTHQSQVPTVVTRLIEEARPFYPHGDTAKAYKLFVEALEHAPDAPANKSLFEELDFGDVGFAGWAAFVCYDVMNEDRDERWSDLLSLIQRKSPATAMRIQEQIAIHSESNRLRDEITTLSEEIEILVEEDAEVEMVRAKLPRLVDASREAGAWWMLRDLANAVSTSAKHRDIAWGLYNAALNISMSRSSKLSSIYLPMGLLRKKEGAYRDAARLFLLSCSEAVTKTASEQLRICLRKLGVAGSGAPERDGLLASAQSAGSDAALAELDKLTAR